jgi:reactive intermediate/imine deaminase
VPAGHRAQRHPSQARTASWRRGQKGYTFGAIEPAAAILHRYAALRRIRAVTRLLDTRWTIPGTRWRFGLDPLLGLVPVVGGVVTLCVSIWLLIESRRIGAPRRLMLAMVGNVALDFLVGEVPIVGDIFDFMFKAHVRNLKMLEKWLTRQEVADVSEPGTLGGSAAVSIVLAIALAHMAGCGSSARPTAHMPARGAVGPYSGSVLADGFCFASGKIAAADAAQGSFADEVRSAIDTIEQELAQSNLTMDDVVTATCYLTDMSLFNEFNAVYAERFREPYPARTTVGVAALPAGRRVEITVIARRP